MKRGVAAALLVGMLACVGCITTAPPDTTKLPLAPAYFPPPPTPVTPNRVTPTNGHLIVQSLNDELDYEARWSATPAP